MKIRFVFFTNVEGGADYTEIERNLMPNEIIPRKGDPFFIAKEGYKGQKFVTTDVQFMYNEDAILTHIYVFAELSKD